MSTVMWHGTGSEVVIKEVGIDDSTPPALAGTLRKLVALELALDVGASAVIPFGPRPPAHSLHDPLLTSALTSDVVLAPRSHRLPIAAAAATTTIETTSSSTSSSTSDSSADDGDPPGAGEGGVGPLDGGDGHVGCACVPAGILECVLALQGHGHDTRAARSSPQEVGAGRQILRATAFLVQAARGGLGVEAELRYSCRSSVGDRPEAGGLVFAVRPEFKDKSLDVAVLGRIAIMRCRGASLGLDMCRFTFTSRKAGPPWLLWDHMANRGVATTALAGDAYFVDPAEGRWSMRRRVVVCTHAHTHMRLNRWRRFSTTCFRNLQRSLGTRRTKLSCFCATACSSA